MVKTVNIKRSALAVVCALVIAAAFAFAGCASSAPQESESSESASSEAPDELAFGEESSTALSLVFENATGADITELSVLPATGEGAPVALMEEGDVLADKEKATVNVEPVNDGGVFTLSFLVGGAPRQLHNVDFSLLADPVIMQQDDVAYITATIDGNAVSSLQEEYDIAHPPAPPEPVYEEPVYYYGESGGDAPAQEEDSCVSDVILN